MEAVDRAVLQPGDGGDRMYELVRVLRARFLDEPQKDYFAGKQAFRNALRSHYRCSGARARRIIERMEGLELLRFERGRWSLFAPVQ